MSMSVVAALVATIGTLIVAMQAATLSRVTELSKRIDSQDDKITSVRERVAKLGG